MALPVPLALVRLVDLADFSMSRFTLGESRQFNRTGGGAILDASLGSRLWTGEIKLTPMPHGVLAGYEARLEMLLEPGASFLVYEKRLTYPVTDPDGSILGASTPTLTAVAVNNIDVTISGLPAGYVLTRGDMFSFQYLSSPTRYALHRVVYAATAADGAGVITVQVIPAIRPGYTLGTAISVTKPQMKAKIIPGTYQAPSGNPGLLSDGLSFQFMQTLK